MFAVAREEFTKRAKYKKFDIVDDFKFPRFPTKKLALKELQRLAATKQINLGSSQYPQKIKVKDPVTGEIVEKEVFGRKVSFNDVREYTLNKHVVAGYMLKNLPITRLSLMTNL